MALAFGAVSTPSGTFTGDTSWTHTPAATPAAVLVFVISDAWAGSGWSKPTITYGGVSVPTILSQGASSGVGVVDGYALLAGIPAGAQTVAVTAGGNTLVKHAACLTVLSTMGGTAVLDSHTGYSAAASVNPQGTVAHSGTLPEWFGASAADFTVATGNSNLLSGETYAGGASFGANSAAYFYRAANAAAASSVYGYAGTASSSIVGHAAVLVEVVLADDATRTGRKGMF